MIKSVSLQEDVVKQAEAYARKNGQTFSGLVRISLESYMIRCVNKDE